MGSDRNQSKATGQNAEQNEGPASANSADWTRQHLPFHIIGNVVDAPRAYSWIKYGAMGRTMRRYSGKRSPAAVRGRSRRE